MSDNTSLRVVGKPLPRVDAADKIRGKARYVDDFNYRGTLHVAMVLSPHAHADILNIDGSAATQVPGVVKVITARDIPGLNQVGCVFPDQPLLQFERVRFVGDRVALVVGQTLAAAREGASQVRVDYRPLPSYHDVSEALADSALRIQPGGNLFAHLKVRHGSGQAAMNNCDVVVEQEYEVNYQEHAYLEPQGMMVVPFESSVTVFGSLQCPSFVQSALARILGWKLAQVRVIQSTTGGAFGGKEDYPSEVAACAALAAVMTKAPCKLIYSRSEDMQASTKRHRMRLNYKIGAASDGTLQALQATIQVDAGAYAGLSTVVAERANSSAAGPYRFAHAHVDTLVVYTNNLLGGAFRGFGNAQVTFALENTINILATRLNMDPVELRRRNLLSEGDALITGSQLPAPAPTQQVLDSLLARSDYYRVLDDCRTFNASNRWKKRGVGLALNLYGCCLHAGGQHLEGSGALVQVRADGSVEVTIGGTDVGQGAFTVAAQIAAEVLGAPYELIRVQATDTSLVPDSGPTVASRTTVMSGNAVRDACAQIRARMESLAAEMVSANAEAGRSDLDEGEFVLADRTFRFADLAREAHRRRLQMSCSGWYAPPPKPWDRETGQGVAYVTHCMAGHVAEVEVDLLSGLSQVIKVTACHDVGRLINPAMAMAQVHGGIMQGMGWALMENLQLDHGRVLNPGFSDYLIPGALDVPQMDAVFIEDPYAAGPFGAKGIGEPTFVTVPAAVAIAVANAASRVPYRLPLTPETVLRWFHHERQETSSHN